MKQELKKGEHVPFTQIANKVLNDPKLSLKAKGLFAYLYSKTDNYQFAFERIQLDHLDGVKSVRSTIKELEKHNYLIRHKQSDGRMIYEIRWDLSQTPKKPTAENRQVEPTAQKANLPKRQPAKTGSLNNIDTSNNTDKSNNTNTPAPAAPRVLSEAEQVIEVFYKTINPNINWEDKRNRNAADWLVKKYGLASILHAATFACEQQTIDRYCPRITTPYQLKEKMSALALYKKTKDQKDPEKVRKVWE